MTSVDDLRAVVRDFVESEATVLPAAISAAREDAAKALLLPSGEDKADDGTQAPSIIEQLSATAGDGNDDALAASTHRDGFVARVCAVVAELGKSEEARLLLTETDKVVRAIHTQLRSAAKADKTPVVTQCLRAIGNLCFDNDAARNHLCSSGGTEALIESLKCLIRYEQGKTAGQPSDSGNSGDTGSEKKIATAASDSSLDDLPGSLGTAGPGTILNAAGENEAFLKDLVSAGVIASITWLLANSPSHAEQNMAFQALLRFAHLDEALADIASEEASDALLGILADCDDEDEANELSALYRKICAKDDLIAPLTTQERVSRILSIARDAGIFPRARVVAAVVLSVLLSEDKVLAQLWSEPGQLRQDTLDLLLDWIRNEDLVDLNVAGLVGIGNICRTDENAVILGQVDDLLPMIIRRIEHQYSFVQHPALGTLKNLLKLPANRDKAVAAGCIPVLMKAANDPQGPIQYLVCSLLRVLAAAGSGVNEVIRALTTDGVFLDRIHHLTESEVAAARCEAMRLLAVIVKTSRDPAAILPLADHKAIDSLSRMLDEEHLLLKMEGCVALVIMSALVGPVQDKVIASDVVAKSLKLVQSSPQLELSLNFLSMYIQLCSNKSFAATSACKEIVELVKQQFAAHENPIAQQQAKGVLQAFATASAPSDETKQ